MVSRSLRRPPEAHESLLQLFAFQRLELVKNREQHYGSNLRDEYKQDQEHGPGDQPPVRGLANGIVEQLNHDRAQDQPDHPAFQLIPSPGAKLLVGQSIAVLQP
jgi:hypothetical protein